MGIFLLHTLQASSFKEPKSVESQVPMTWDLPVGDDTWVAGYLEPPDPLSTVR